MAAFMALRAVDDVKGVGMGCVHRQSPISCLGDMLKGSGSWMVQ